MIGYGNLLVLKFGEVEYHSFHINEFKKLFKSVHSINYDTYFKQHGINQTEKYISNYIDSEHIDLIIIWLFFGNFELSVEYLNTLRRKAPVVFWFFDDEVFFHSFNKYYAQIADAVITTSYYERFAYEQLDIPAILYFGSYSKLDYYPLFLEKTIDVSFVGIREGRPEREAFTDFLKKNGIHVQLFGSGFNNGFITQKRMNEIFSSSKINLNFTQIYQQPLLYDDNVFLKRIKQNKGRPIEISLTKSFCLSQFAPSIDMVFKIKNEIDVFYSKEELLEKVKYYLDNDHERELIANNAFNKAICNYESSIYLRNTFNELFDKLKLNKTKRFIYDEIYISSSFKKMIIAFYKDNIINQIPCKNRKNIIESIHILLNNNVSFFKILILLFKKIVMVLFNIISKIK